MRILVIGNGAREHTLAWKIAQSPRVDKLFIAPGNASTATIGENLDVAADDIPSLTKAAQDNRIDLVIVGPEAPLVSGIVDALQEVGIPAFGPDAQAAQIEGSKAFAKDLMQKHNIPCAESATFTSIADASDYVKKQSFPLVIKADGLAAGKGSITVESQESALQVLSDLMERRIFGDAGDRVVIEECLVGKEVSLVSFTDGKTTVPMISACDYKRALDNDQGPNTGGMGSYSPSEFFTPELSEQVMKTIVNPTIKALEQAGIAYKGVLYAGLMITSEGPKVLEFNARFGDPETQVVLPLLETDLVDIIQAVTNEKLDQMNIQWKDEVCVGVVMASGGYPGSYEKGFPIEGLNNVNDDVLVFHAGTKNNESGQIITSGGRVLTVVATGKTYSDARSKVYENAERIRFEGCQYRKDIGIVNAK
ncbi:MAG: phosphoribosylamine--glycine ligase [Dehalococcoidia bacterium]